VQAVEQAFAATLASLGVDIGLKALFEEIYVPLAAWILAQKRQREEPLVLGINGAQGAGKSTLFNLLEVILGEGFGLRVVGFSIDDIYKTRADREAMADRIHPLFVTRGVPGTHDVALGLAIIDSLCSADPERVTRIPVFDKSIDDRCPDSVWQEWVGGADLIVLEGWCVGARPQPDAALREPVNTLERDEDPDGIWRRYVNEQLRGPYQTLFSRLDLLLMLCVPSMDAVYEWRSLQEKKLAERVQYLHDAQPPDPLRIMDGHEIKRFIQHYERLTRAMLEELPERADLTLFLNENHKIAEIRLRKPLREG